MKLPADVHTSWPEGCCLWRSDAVTASHRVTAGPVRRWQRVVRPLWAASVTVVLTACAVGPDYQRPEVDVGLNYKALSDAAQAVTAQADSGWLPVQGSDDTDSTAWWTVFADPVLDGMMRTLMAGNFDLARAQAQYTQAQAALRQARSDYFPTLGGSVGATRSGSGAQPPANQYSLTAQVSWEPDLWGRVRRSVEAGEAGLQASAADVATVALSLQSVLGQTYFRLRAMDADRDLLARTLRVYERSLEMTENRVAAGVAAPADVALARSQLENTRRQWQSLGWQRAQLEHALAVLQGQAPVRFELAPQPLLQPGTPDIPAGLPAALLQRRPDVAAAERRVAQANARIGVAQAAWFPDLVLSAQGGFRSGQWAQWLTAPARVWSLGPALALTIFDAGARSARVDEARAAYDAEAARYRQTVLDALREVEDQLVQLDSLEQELLIQKRALDAARQSLQGTRNQYEAGMIDYLDVVQVEATALNAERTMLSLQAESLVATVQLIAALGGGWEAPY